MEDYVMLEQYSLQQFIHNTNTTIQTVKNIVLHLKRKINCSQYLVRV